MIRASTTTTDASYLQMLAARREGDVGSNGAADLEAMINRCEISDVTDNVDGPDGLEYNEPRGLQYNDFNHWKPGPQAASDEPTDINSALQLALGKLQALTQNVAQLEMRLSQSEASNALLEERIAEAMAARAASQSTSPMKGAAAAANPQSPPARPMSAKSKPESPI